MIATFAPDGSDGCSSLPIAHYATIGLVTLLGPGYVVLQERRRGTPHTKGIRLALHLGRPPAKGQRPGH